MILRGAYNAIRFEQAHAEQERQGNLTFDRAQNPRVALHLPQRAFYGLEAVLSHEVSFI